VQQVLENIWVDVTVLKEVEEFLAEWNSTSEVIMAQTSGSTGAPKQIKLSKKGLLFSARNTNTFFKLNENSKALLCLPLATIGGKMMLVRALESKMTLFIDSPSSNPLSKRDEYFDFVAVTPMQLSKMVQESLHKTSKIKSILVGGAPMNENLICQLKENKLTVYHGYGMTETASHVSLRKVGFESDEYYKAMPGIHFSYGNNKTLTIHYPALHDAPIETTDSVELIDEFKFKWVGRNDFVVNSGGIKIHVEEIEYELSTFIQLPFFVAGIPDDVLGEKLILCIESNDNEVIIDFNFLGVKKPREVMYFAKFSYTESGKINRKATVNQLNLNK